MFTFRRLTFSLLVLNLLGGAIFAQEDDKKPVPATATPTNQPRDPLLLPQHDEARNDAEQAYRRSDHKKVIELTSGVLSQNPKDHVAMYLRGSSRVDLGSATGDAALVRAGITDARESITVKQKDNLNYYLPYLKGMTSLAAGRKQARSRSGRRQLRHAVARTGNAQGEERSNTLYQRALAYSAIQDQVKAIGDLQEAIRITPNHLGARVDLGERFQRSDRVPPR